MYILDIVLKILVDREEFKIHSLFHETQCLCFIGSYGLKKVKEEPSKDKLEKARRDTRRYGR